MSEIKLLIVEDDPEQIKNYQRDIKSFNLESPVKVIETIEKDKNQALHVLEDEDRFFDAAIVDLKLDNKGVEDQDYSGNEVLRKIKGKLRFPVFVVSGTPQHLADDLKEESCFFKIKTRGEEVNHLEQLVKIYNTGITNILGKKGIIEGHLNTIFWNHLSNSMDLWVNDTKRSPEEKQKTLLRYTLLHIQEYLEISEVSGFEDYHPSEIYITPCIKPNVFTGDLVESQNDSVKHIVLTPSCDLAQAKAKDILIVEIEPPSQGILSEKVNMIKKGKASPEDLQSAENNLKGLINNSFSPKYHYLPKYGDMEGGLINFQKMRSVRVKEFSEQFNRIASINSTFTKDIVARFSYYYSRQGSPDFDTNEIYETLFQS